MTWLQLQEILLTFLKKRLQKIFNSTSLRKRTEARWNKVWRLDKTCIKLKIHIAFINTSGKGYSSSSPVCSSSSSLRRVPSPWAFVPRLENSLGYTSNKYRGISKTASELGQTGICTQWNNGMYSVCTSYCALWNIWNIFSYYSSNEKSHSLKHNCLLIPKYFSEKLWEKRLSDKHSLGVSNILITCEWNLLVSLIKCAVM